MTTMDINVVSDAELQVGQPITSAKLKMLRDIILAIQEGDASAASYRIASAALADYPWSGDDFIDVTAGNYVLNSIRDTNQTFPGGGSTPTSYTKFAEFYAAHDGTYRTVIDLISTTSTSYFRVYKNGVAEGTERNATGATTWTEDIAFVRGDLIQCYGYNVGSANAMDVKFQICDNTPHAYCGGLRTLESAK